MIEILLFTGVWFLFVFILLEEIIMEFEEEEERFREEQELYAHDKRADDAERMASLK